MPYTVTHTTLPEVLILEPKVFGDACVFSLPPAPGWMCSLCKTSTAAAPGVCCPQVLAMNDPTVGIQWPVGAPPLLAAKDAAALTLDQAELFA